MIILKRDRLILRNYKESDLYVKNAMLLQVM